MESPILFAQGVVARDPERRLNVPLDFTLGPRENIALMGLNGSGKTLVIETLLGHLFLREGHLEYHFRTGSDKVFEQIRHIAFRDAYGTADGQYYYQQRWNASDRESVPRVSELLDQKAMADPRYGELLRVLGVDKLLSKQVILLSSGELRKFQIVRQLYPLPQVLILESPFIGLDATARSTLENLLKELSERSDIRIILSVSAPSDIPKFITHVYPIKDKTCGPRLTRAEFLATEGYTRQRQTLAATYRERPIVLPVATPFPIDSEEIVRMQGVRIEYGGHTLLGPLDWVIRRGEKWRLAGPNGSGKSTLLSLICADNPQSYAQPIDLFGRRRGTGESIWEIKRRIGYVSPEMHRSYLKDIPAIDIVASGYFDSIGLYRRPDEEQRTACQEWLRAFGIEALRDRSFLRLSSGEQRLLLLARAFVKDPPLLILDEPFHGLDCLNKERARAVIEAFCNRPDKTLIYVSHYPEETPACVTQLLELHKN